MLSLRTVALSVDAYQERRCDARTVNSDTLSGFQQVNWLPGYARFEPLTWVGVMLNYSSYALQRIVLRMDRLA
jgi:hypothetical protein